MYIRKGYFFCQNGIQKDKGLDFEAKLLRGKHCRVLFGSEPEVRLIFCENYELFFTAPLNNMRTLKFNAQPTNVFFATVNQMFGGSSQLSTTVERAVIKSLSTGSDNETVLGSSRKL